MGRRRCFSGGTQGQKVEVSLDDEGFEGAWYEATITEVLPDGRGYKVAYHSLTVEGTEPPQPLTEKIRCSNVRPRPTQQLQPGARFNLHQVVDAHYNDGWWVGVVSKVVPCWDGERYAVCFPFGEEQLEFGPSILRPHLDWDPTREKWVSPEELAKEETLFRPEAKVEVSREMGISLTAWFPATIVTPVWKNTFLVQYESLRTDGGVEFLSEIVESQDIRPCPPCASEVRNFEHLDEIEAFYHGGWWPGVILNIGSRCTVISTSWGKEVEFGQSDLRLCYVWIDGKWIQKTKDKSNKSQKLDGNKSIGHKRPSYANVSQKVSVPIRATTSSGSVDETTNSRNEKENISIIHGQSDSLQPCKKSKEGETIEDSTLLRDCLLTARGPKIPNKVDTKFDVAMRVSEGRGNCMSSSVDEEYHSKSPSNGSGSKFLHIAREIPSNPSSGPLNDGPPVKHTPVDMTEPSILEGKHINSEDKGYKHQLVAASIFPSSVGVGTFDINDFPLTTDSEQFKVVQCSNMNSIQQKRNITAKHSRCSRRRGPPGVGMEQQRGMKKRGRPKAKTIAGETSSKDTKLKTLGQTICARGIKKRGRPPKAKTTDKETSSKGTELKTLGQTNPVVSAREHIIEEGESPLIGVSGHVSFGIQPFGVGDKATNVAAEQGHLIEGIERSVTGDAHYAHRSNGQQDVMVSSNTNFKENSEVETRREKQNGSLQHPLGGEIQKRSIIEKERQVTDRLTSVSPSKNISTPFVKSSPMWEAIESLEVFRSMPQQPHYRPLEQYPEELREGTAIGLMGTFTILVGNMHKLRICDPQVAFEEKLNTAILLEDHGFDVQCIRARLEELRRIKHNQEQSGEKRAVLDGQLFEQQNAKQRLDEDLIELEESIAALHKRRASIIMQREKVYSQIVKLQMDVKAVEQAYLSAEHDFGRALASEL